jgi:hypothetical protein
MNSSYFGDKPCYRVAEIAIDGDNNVEAASRRSIGPDRLPYELAWPDLMPCEASFRLRNRELVHGAKMYVMPQLGVRISWRERCKPGPRHHPRVLTYPSSPDSRTGRIGKVNRYGPNVSTKMVGGSDLK